MAIDPELVAMMSSTVTFRPPASRSVKGQKSYGTAVAAKAYVKYKSTTLSGDPAKTKVADGYAILDGVYDMNDEWDIALPSGGPLDGRPVYLVEVAQFADENGPHHTTVYFGARS